MDQLGRVASVDFIENGKPQKLKQKSNAKFNSRKDNKLQQSSIVSFSDNELTKSELGDTLSKARLVKNYFGLPPYATQHTPEAIIYQSRGAIKYDEKDDYSMSARTSSEEIAELLDVNCLGESLSGLKAESNSAAQRKVANSLLSMANTESMTNYFLHKGGVEAVTRLVSETTDHAVLTVCASCIVQASEKEENCEVLIAKDILACVNSLAERGDEAMKLQCAKIMCNLSCVSGNAQDMLVMAGALASLQSFLAGQSNEIICYAILALCNICTSLEGNDAEVAVRACIHATKKLDVVHDFYAAIFMTRMFCNLSCIAHFTSVMCEESCTPLLLHMIDAHLHEEIISYCAEALLNLSLNRKNRREIGSSGVANYLSRIFTHGDPIARARILTTIGNLLTGAYFFEKIAREDIISAILSDLYDPFQPKQFTAVSYCISQLASNEACSNILVHCGVIQLTIGYLSNAPLEAAPYMWNVLVSISQQIRFFDVILRERQMLFATLLSEAEKHSDQRIEAIAALAFNLCLRPQLDAHLEGEQIELLVKTLKLIITKSFSLKSLMLTALVNVASNIKASRSFILSDNLINLLQEGGDCGPIINIKCAALVNLISCQENCCLQLIEAGAHALLVSVHASLSSYSGVSETVERTKSTRTRSSEKAATSPERAQIETLQSSDVAFGQGLIAATLHNLSLKRSTLGPGVLSILLNLIRNTKSLRVLHCVRCLANISTQSKAKNILAKEKKLLPLLTAIMRCGCEEADRVQHYCAIIICNVLSTKIDRVTMDETIQAGIIVDLVVVTLLRVNSLSTKESLGKALFNLMSPSDTRALMVTELDVLSACIDLARMESLDLLEICVRCIYNISCQIPRSSNTVFAKKFSALKVPALMVARASSSGSVPGSKPTAAIKYLCGMALANMSFDTDLAIDLTHEKVANAAYTVMSLDSDEATYCVAVLLFNLSQQSNCITLADTQAIPLLTAILPRGPAVCTQLATAALCNMSMYDSFYFQLCEVALSPIVKVVASSQYDAYVRSDARRSLYNVVTKYNNAKAYAINAEAVSALMSYTKAQTDEKILTSIGRILKEMCSEASDDALHKKLLSDGIMPLLLKLSKIEIPELKLDVAVSMFSLTTGGDTMKVLKWDSVDVLFWLTLHDCLGMNEPIQRNVGRALRNFTSTKQEAKILVKEDRFMAVLRALSKSKSEDVLWQAAGVCYNLFSVEECRKSFLSRGAMTLIFDLAATGFTTVRHVCSACLHMVPESMPDMEDPMVLQLILCLLDADGERHAELGERTLVPLPYSQPALVEKSPQVHQDTNFKPTWVTITCSVDTVFTPATLIMPQSTPQSNAVRPFDTAAILNSQGHTKLKAGEFNNFKPPANERAEAEEEYSSDEEVDRAKSMKLPKKSLEKSGTDSAFNMQLKLPAAHPPAPPSGSNSRANSASNTERGHKTSARGGRQSSLIKPENASHITFPKLIANKKGIPEDTLSAIRSTSMQKSHSVRFSSDTITGVRPPEDSMFTTPKSR